FKCFIFVLNSNKRVVCTFDTKVRNFSVFYQGKSHLSFIWEKFGFFVYRVNLIDLQNIRFYAVYSDNFFCFGTTQKHYCKPYSQYKTSHNNPFTSYKNLEYFVSPQLA